MRDWICNVAQTHVFPIKIQEDALLSFQEGEGRGEEGWLVTKNLSHLVEMDGNIFLFVLHGVFLKDVESNGEIHPITPKKTTGN